MHFKKKKTSQNTLGNVTDTAAVMTVAPTLLPPQPAAPESPSPQITPPLRSPSPQIIEDRYIDDDKLLELCSKRFPSGSYRLSFKFNRWYLDAPDWLDERTLELCEIDLSV